MSNICKKVYVLNLKLAFLNTNVNEKVDIFYSTILNIPCNFIPHEFVVCDDKDPPWFNKKIRALIQEKNVAFKNYRNNSSNIDLKCRLKYLQTCLNASIEVTKEKYYHNAVNKLIILVSIKTFIKNNKKIPIIPTPFYENRFIINFKEKAQIFNIFVSKQCSLILNNNSLPANVNYITDKRLSTVTFSAKDIGKIIPNLDSNKAHGHDNISIRMLKICGDSICVPLEMIFKQTLLTGVFLSEWKKGNTVPIHRKSDKQNIKNCRPVSLLPICGKIFERLIFNEMFIYFSANKLISKNQSGFQSGVSCIKQPLSITYEIFTYFDNGLEVRSAGMKGLFSN